MQANDSGKGFAFLSTTLGRLVEADACAGMNLGEILLSDLHQRVLSSSELNYQDCNCRSLGCQI